jgi:hypothetical protein
LARQCPCPRWLETIPSDGRSDQHAPTAVASCPIDRWTKPGTTPSAYSHRLEAFVGNREIRSLVEPNRGQVLKLRAGYETCFRRLVQAGAAAGVFTVTSVRVASYAILDLGMGVSAWYRETGEYSEDALVWQYSEFALRLVGARP